MATMILACGACAAQNFVSAERLAAAHAPPLCWKCGEALPVARETAPAPRESKENGKKSPKTGGRRE